MIPARHMELVDLAAAVIRGDAVPAAAFDSFEPGAICDLAQFHGVLPLVAHRLAGRTDVSVILRSMLRDRAGEAATVDLLREREAKRLIAALAANRIDALIFKGSHLAYSYYARPDLRPRLDTDLLIPADRRQAAQALLQDLGYELLDRVSGELVTGQSLHVLRQDGFLVHQVDLHWKVAIPLVFAHVLSYEELAERSVPIPALGPAARGPCDVDALFIACVHRVAHHADLVGLNWLYDIHLVAERLEPAGWRQFVALATERQMAAVCASSLERAAFWFHTRVPESAAERLRVAQTRAGERSAAYLSARPQAEALIDDLRTLRSWRDRWRLVREHLFPSAAYMRRVYAPASALPLPLLYLWRITRGARKWLTR